MSLHKKNDSYDVIILGSGSAGLQCALTAAKRNLSVLVLDHNDCAGRKLSISGGGKCFLP